MEDQEHTQPQPQQRQPEGIDWDAALAELREEHAAARKVSYVSMDRLELHLAPVGFELVFTDGNKTHAFAINDVQAAQLALAIMQIISNRS